MDGNYRAVGTTVLELIDQEAAAERSTRASSVDTSAIVGDNTSSASTASILSFVTTINKAGLTLLTVSRMYFKKHGV